MSVVPGPQEEPEDEGIVEGEVVDGGSAPTDSEAAGNELALLAGLAARGLYTPGMALGGASLVIGAVLAALAFPAWDGSRLVSLLSCFVAVLLLLCGGYLLWAGVAARRAVSDQDRIAQAFTTALQQRRTEGGGAEFERDLIGQATPLLGGGTVRNTRALFGALGQLPGRWSQYPELRPFLRPVTTIAVRSAIASGLGAPVGLFLIILSAIAGLLG